MTEENKKIPRGVVGVMVFKDGKVLIGKRRDTATHAQGEYSFPGGKIEEGESFKEAIERETLEEAGIKIKNLKFLCVINVTKYKGFPAILLGFSADVDNSEPKSFPEEKIGEWQWVDLKNIPKPLFYPTSIIIDSYKTGKNYYDKE